MGEKPTYEELEKRVKQLETELEKPLSSQADQYQFGTAFKMLADQLEDMVYYFHIPTKSFVYFNKKAVDLYGIREDRTEDVTSKRAARGIHPDDQEKIRAARSESLKPGRSQGEVAYRLHDFHGTWHWIHDKWVVIRDESGNPVNIMAISRDETKQKRMAEELSETQLIYRTVFESTGTAMMVIEEDMTVSLVNAEFERMTGYGKSEVEGSRKWLALVSQEDRDRMRNYHDLRKTDPHLAPKSYGLSLEDKSGRVKNLLAIVGIVPGTQRSVASMVDITDLKQAEEALRKSEERFRSLIEKARDLITVMDMDGTIRYESPSSERVLGYMPEELIGKNVLEYIHPDDLPKAAAALTPEAATPEIAPFMELRFRHKDGSWRVLEAIGRDLREHPEVAGIVVNSRDITERKRVEEALRLSEEKYRTVLENIQAGYYEVDIAGNFTFINPTFPKILGYTEEEMRDMSYRHFTDKEQAEIVYRTYNAVYRTGISTHVDWELKKKGGDKVFMETSVSLMRDSFGQPIGFRGIVHDVTGRKQAEEEIASSFQKLRKALNGIIRAVSLTVEARDPYTAGHQRRVSDLARSIATEMGLSKDQIEGIRMAGIIHDLGKMSIPAEILSKPTKLSDMEFELIKCHPQSGYDILKMLTFPGPSPRSYSSITNGWMAPVTRRASQTAGFFWRQESWRSPTSPRP